LPSSPNTQQPVSLGALSPHGHDPSHAPAAGRTALNVKRNFSDRLSARLWSLGGMADDVGQGALKFGTGFAT
jgi:hypothetical protein